MSGKKRRRAVAALIAALGFGGLARIATAAEWTANLLPDSRIFRPFIADPNERKLSVEYVWADRGHVENFLFHIGTTIPLVAFHPAESQPKREIQLGVDGGAFLVITGRNNFPLQVTDFQAGLPLDYRTGPLSLRLRYGHLSSHLGDDYINHHPYDRRERASTDSIEAFASYDFGATRLYGGASYAFHAVPDAGRAILHGGLEWESRPLWIDPLTAYFAADVQSKEENDYSTNEAVQAGFVLHAASGRALRFGFTYFDGHAPLRQFFRERVRWYGLGVFYAPKTGL